MAVAAITTIDAGTDVRLLRLMQLVSPTLPVGAFAYSQGMEWAVQAGWVNNAPQTAQWIGNLLTHCMANLDVPVFSRLYSAWRTDRLEAFDAWNCYLLAGRGSAELQQEDRQMGQALLRLLKQLQPDRMVKLFSSIPTLTAMFAAAACNWDIGQEQACAGLLWSWCENQVTAAIKLVPLGQTDGQKILMGLAETVAQSVRHGQALADEAIGAMAPGLSMASALHETQHTRLFRS
jgi:urease accessory protein